MFVLITHYAVDLQCYCKGRPFKLAKTYFITFKIDTDIIGSKSTTQVLVAVF